MQVHYSEGVATHTGPESCVQSREGLGEALTGVRIGQPLSGENPLWGADVLENTEGHTGRRVNASAVSTPRRLRPWHVRTPSVREPGGLRIWPLSLAVRIGKVESRSR